MGSLKSGSRVNTLSARFRHYNIKLLLFSTQVFRYVSNVVRQNTTNLIVGSPFPNRKELNKIAEEFGDVFGGPNQFLKIYALCTPERYDFMHCDLQANPPLAYHCFDYVVAEGDKIVVGGGNSVDIPEDVFSATTKSSDVGNGSSSAKLRSSLERGQRSLLVRQDLFAIKGLWYI